MRFLIAPSLLSADMAHMADQVMALQEAGADLLHFDIADGHFAPNLSFGPAMVAAIKKYATKPIDVHLMVEDPASFAPQFIEAGADNITFHPEAKSDPAPLIARIRDLGATASMSLRPETPPHAVMPFAADLQMIMVLSVNPGFSGQKMLLHCLEKISWLRKKLGGEFDIQVDGGVNSETISDVARSGGNVVVAGAAIFGQPDLRQAIADLRAGLQRDFAPSTT